MRRLRLERERRDESGEDWRGRQLGQSTTSARKIYLWIEDVCMGRHDWGYVWYVLFWLILLMCGKRKALSVLRWSNETWRKCDSFLRLSPAMKQCHFFSWPPIGFERPLARGLAFLIRARRPLDAISNTITPKAPAESYNSLSSPRTKRASHARHNARTLAFRKLRSKQIAPNKQTFRATSFSRPRPPTLDQTFHKPRSTHLDNDSLY